MGTPITVGGLLVALAIAVGLALLIGGASTTFAGMMAGASGDASTQRKGCGISLAGIALLVLCVWNLA